ncbi:hypothetical protein GJ496_003741 [Pomphorhynchus laevis]|nr:hypothetical protein GJ496_003741 [Pomphorhynchus laevis]
MNSRLSFYFIRPVKVKPRCRMDKLAATTLRSVHVKLRLKLRCEDEFTAVVLLYPSSKMKPRCRMDKLAATTLRSVHVKLRCKDKLATGTLLFPFRLSETPLTQTSIRYMTKPRVFLQVFLPAVLNTHANKEHAAALMHKITTGKGKNIEAGKY